MVVPSSYVPNAIVRDGPTPRMTSVIPETRGGTFRAESIATKVFRVTEEPEDYDKIETVRQVVPTMGNVVVSAL